VYSVLTKISHVLRQSNQCSENSDVKNQVVNLNDNIIGIPAGPLAAAWQIYNGLNQTIKQSITIVKSWLSNPKCNPMFFNSKYSKAL
jgi:hypothetical protein